MKLREHHLTAELIDGEETSILAVMAESHAQDKSSEEYTQAVNNLKTLQEAKKLEIDMINERESLASEFFRGMAGGALSAGLIYLIWSNEAGGDVMLNTSDKSFIKDAAKLRFKPMR